MARKNETHLDDVATEATEEKPALTEVDVEDASIEESPEIDSLNDDLHASEELEGSSLSSKVLTGITLLAAGGVLALWGGPKVAPYLPKGMAPVAAFLEPGSKGTAEQITGLRSEIDEKVSAFISEDVPKEISASITSYDTKIQERLTALSDQVKASDGADIESRLSRIETTVEGLDAQMQTLTASLTSAVSNSEGLSTEAAQKIAGYQATIKGLQAEIQSLSTQQGKLSQKIDDVSVTSDRKVKEAEQEVASAAVLRALSELTVAIDAGGPFTLQLKNLADAGLEIPEQLAAVANDGVVPLAKLKSDFSGVAHKALKAAIGSQEATGLGNKLGLFLKSQVTVRSLEPKDGDDVDAVLSRVQAALDNDDLVVAVKEADILPDAAKSAVASWLQDVNGRIQAIQSLNALKASIDS